MIFEEDFEEYDDSNGEPSVDISFITTSVIDNDEFSLSFVDYNLSDLSDNQLSNNNDDIQRQAVHIRFDESLDSQVISMGVFRIKKTLSKDYIGDEEIKKEFIERANELSELNFDDKFIFKYDNELSETLNNRKLSSKILGASLCIGTGGRIGPANYMIINQDNYDKIINFIPADLYLSRVEVIIYPIKDIILFRKNPLDQPGLVLIKNIFKYELVNVGLHPERQFFKIKMNDDD